MKLHKIFLLTALLPLSLNLYAKEYEYIAKCRNFNHIGLFEQCLDKELAFYDGKLNGLYVSFGNNRALENSELLWIKFKDADCAYMARSSTRNLKSRLIYKACILEKTKIRIEELKKANFPEQWLKAT